MNKKELKQLKKAVNNLTEEQKQFLKLLNNYGLSLCLTKDNQSINELTEIIRIQNERREHK